jgi:EAL domain-containing protein (putative c-di-GMP-specific phosphodiesterase class I)
MIQILDYDKIYKEMGGLGYDKCVQDFSNLLKTSFGLHSTAGRIEEDIFVVVVSDVVDPDKVSAMCSSFRKKATQALDIDIILGMAPITETYSDPKVWFNDARTALKQIQKSGGQQAFLSQTMQGNSIARWRMESDLEQALQSNQVETWFQPIVNLENGKAVGYEALCRWTHPQKGPISPAEFIPIAENEGPLILEIGKLTLKQSCETLAKLTEDRNEDLFMSINLSPVQLLKDRLLAQHIQKTIRGANLDPRKIKFEVTETAVMHEKEKAIEALQRIRQTGAKISMDDFGTGYSSLAHLKEFPISTLKIDRSFVAGSDHNDEARAMLNTIIELARGLELDVVAEGIETEGERDLLIDLGCGYGQGWLFGKPLPPDDL